MPTVELTSLNDSRRTSTIRGELTILENLVQSSQKTVVRSPLLLGNARGESNELLTGQRSSLSELFHVRVDQRRELKHSSASLVFPRRTPRYFSQQLRIFDVLVSVFAQPFQQTGHQLVGKVVEAFVQLGGVKNRLREMRREERLTITRQFHRLLVDGVQTRPTASARGCCPRL